jgi:hypothetical protein
MIERKELKIGKTILVWDKVEAVKFLGFGCGVFSTILITSILLLKKGQPLLPCMMLAFSGAVGLMITSLFMQSVIKENFS